jgi:hypothetical protein
LGFVDGREVGGIKFREFFGMREGTGVRFGVCRRESGGRAYVS